MKKKKANKPVRYRSAITGKFVSATYAKRYPHLVVGEEVRKAHHCDPRGEAWYNN